MKPRYPLRLIVGLSVLMLFAFVSLVRNELVRSASERADEVSPVRKRLSIVKTELPPRCVVGFVTDAVDTPDNLAASKRLYLTQYVLAPVLVVPGQEHHDAGEWDYLVVDNASLPVHLLKSAGRGAR